MYGLEQDIHKCMWQILSKVSILCELTNTNALAVSILHFRYHKVAYVHESFARIGMGWYRKIWENYIFICVTVSHETGIVLRMA